MAHEYFVQCEWGRGLCISQWNGSDLVTCLPQSEGSGLWNDRITASRQHRKQSDNPPTIPPHIPPISLFINRFVLLAWLQFTKLFYYQRMFLARPQRQWVRCWRSVEEVGLERGSYAQLPTRMRGVWTAPRSSASANISIAFVFCVAPS